VGSVLRDGAEDDDAEGAQEAGDAEPDEGLLHGVSPCSCGWMVSLQAVFISRGEKKATVDGLRIATGQIGLP
jgi:hypothetical protein